MALSEFQGLEKNTILKSPRQLKQNHRRCISGSLQAAEKLNERALYKGTTSSLP
jgi:hypothetical protein